MRDHGISIRDTWYGYEGPNFDDFYTNNNKYYEKKHIEIVIKEEGYTEVQGNKAYSIPGFKHCAYDNYKILIPKRLVPLNHPIIHETVHFLQENDLNKEKTYIPFNGNNYFEYISQKCELEAHFIQLLYIVKFENFILEKLSFDKRAKLNDFFSKPRTIGDHELIDILIFAKSENVI